jgi:predicted dehydrogenase
LHRLQYFDHGDEGRLRGWRDIHVTDREHPYMSQWWVPGLQIGYEHTFIHQTADFLRAAAEGKSAAPTFRDGLMTDYVTDAVLASAKSRQWTHAGARKGVIQHD